MFFKFQFQAAVVLTILISLVGTAQEKGGELLAEVTAATFRPRELAAVRDTTALARKPRMAMQEILETPLKGKLSLELINRIEGLPQEKADVDAGLFGEELEAEEVSVANLLKGQADHWKPLLVLLTAHHESIPMSEAAAKVEVTLVVSEKLGNAAMVQEGLNTEDESAAMEARLSASEVLLADLVRKVMMSRRSEEWWSEWRDTWNRGMTRVPEDLIGQWSVKENSSINFAQATIADQRCTVIWQERAGGKVQKIDFDVIQATDGQLSAGEEYAGLRYQLRHETEYEPILIFDVPGRRADSIVKLELRPDW